MRDPYSTLRREYRAIVPAQRRRKHLILLLRRDDKDRTEPTIEAIVRPEDREALRPLMERLFGNLPGAFFRIAPAEDGFCGDVNMLWQAGERVERTGSSKPAAP